MNTIQSSIARSHFSSVLDDACFEPQIITRTRDRIIMLSEESFRALLPDRIPVRVTEDTDGTWFVSACDELIPVIESRESREGALLAYAKALLDYTGDVLSDPMWANAKNIRPVLPTLYAVSLMKEPESVLAALDVAS